jgi:hypothetical protein
MREPRSLKIDVDCCLSLLRLEELPLAEGRDLAPLREPCPVLTIW